MVEPDTVRQIRMLREFGWGKKRIAREVGVSIGTVMRYLRLGAAAERQQRPAARRLDEAGRAAAVELLETTAQGNAAVVAQLLAEQGVEASLRTVQRAVADHRKARRAAEAATVRFETAPGHQTQIDFGEKRVRIGGRDSKVLLFVAVLSYSRRIFVKAFHSQRQDDWREGLWGAFRCFGGVTQTVLVDNARAMVIGRDFATQTAILHPAFAMYCRELGVAVRACQPYRARTKGKTESGVGYVKRNAIAGREFESFAALEAHLETWCRQADEREHGTTHEAPRLRFDRDEATLMRALPLHPPPARERRLVREYVEVQVGEDDVRIFHDGEVVATHRRGREPYQRIVDPSHLEGLWRRQPEPPLEPTTSPSPLEAMGRSLGDYQAIVGGES